MRLLNTRKDTAENKVPMYLLVCKGLTIDDVGVSREPRISGDTVGGWFLKPSICVKETLGGGATVERLLHSEFLA